MLATIGIVDRIFRRVGLRPSRFHSYAWGTAVSLPSERDGSITVFFYSYCKCAQSACKILKPHPKIIKPRPKPHRSASVTNSVGWCGLSPIAGLWLALKPRSTNELNQHQLFCVRFAYQSCACVYAYIP